VGEAKERFYLPQLDGLRFFAFLLVFLHHSPLFPGGSRAASFLKQLGWVGVDLFFVLSAYLLIALLQREYSATGDADFRKFYIRRALRIWPLFYFYIGVCFLYFVAVDGNNIALVAGRTIGHLFFVDNFFTAISDEYNPLNFTPHLWTIAFEEQIYVLIPLLFMAIWALRGNRKLIALTAVIVAISQPLLRLGLTWFYHKERAVWVTPFVHFDTIFAGVLLGSGVGSGLRERVSGDVLAFTGAIVLGIIFLLPPSTDFSMFLPDQNILVFTLLAVAFFFIVLGCLDEASWISGLLAHQPFVFLGRISYGLYVWHLAGNRLGPELSRSWLSAHVNSQNEYVAWFTVVLPALLLTIALAVLSYFLLERPFLRVKSRFTIVMNRKD
jgi:peptidoglycan/LPS O-acetylase OafA/YrhL